MKLDHAIVMSTIGAPHRQNRLIAKSLNIDKSLTAVLCQWSPGRDELAFGESESINFFHVDHKTLALSRSYVGGREDSLDGGRHIFTHFVVFDHAQLAAYDNNVALMLHILRSEGHLFLSCSVSSQLQQLEIPDRPYFIPFNNSGGNYSSETETVMRGIDVHQRVAIVGLQDPHEFLGSFLAEVPVEKRTQISFATGMSLAAERPFTLQFFSQTDAAFEKELATHRLRTISMRSKPRQRLQA